MLARIGPAFDSPDFLFEIKWDGTRAMTFRDARGYRLQNRRHRSQKERYPELDCLRALPAGTVIDGEIVVLQKGKPTFEGMLRREQAHTIHKVAAAARAWPATYVVFDLLYEKYGSVMNQPCSQRRERLREIIRKLDVPCVAMSEGVVGTGVAYFEQAVKMELEGIVAKRLSSPYLPGLRTDHWIKCKRRQELVCGIIGYQLSDDGHDLRSLIIAGEVEDEIRCLGKVGTGLNEKMRKDLLVRLANLHARTTGLQCDVKGIWVKPELFCRVSYLEVTPAGQLRAPVFEGLVEPGER